MARIYFPDNTRQEYFDVLKRLSSLSWVELANKLNISIRHLRDCRRGIYSLSTSISDYISKQYSLDLPKNVVVKADY